MKWVKSTWNEIKTNEKLLRKCWENVGLDDAHQNIVTRVHETIEDAAADGGSDGEYDLNEDFDDEKEDDWKEMIVDPSVNNDKESDAPPKQKQNKLSGAWGALLNGQ